MSQHTPQKLLLNACRGEPVDRLPVWMMRQAGRYLPEYRKIRKKYDFTTMYKQPELAAEVTLQPLKRFPLDAAIIFSDILVIPEAMGMALAFVEGKGPQFQTPLTNVDELHILSRDGIEEKLGFVFQTLTLVSQEVDASRTVIGFSGAPWTLAVYMVEGGTSRDFRRIKQWRFQHPQLLHRLMDRLAVAVTDYLVLQARAGAEVVQLFDSWVGILDEDGVREFVIPYVQRIIAQVKRETDVPIIYFPRGGMQWLPELARTGADIYGIDWTLSLASARRQLLAESGVQGNLDPTVLLTDGDTIQRTTRHMLDAVENHRRYIVNLGHGILPQTPVHHARIFIETVKTYSVPVPETSHHTHNTGD